MDYCVFCKIAAGQIPVVSIYEDDDILVFLDHEPIRNGHVLILTKEHYPYFDDLPIDLLWRVCRLGRQIAKIQRNKFGVNRAGMMFSGNDVPHCHAHVVPLHKNTDLTSGRYFIGKNLRIRRRPRADLEELIETSKSLSNLIEEVESDS